eukprot:328233-Chlamydomonas_euryale.AAC.1
MPTVCLLGSSGVRERTEQLAGAGSACQNLQRTSRNCAWQQNDKLCGNQGGKASRTRLIISTPHSPARAHASPGN